VIITDDEEVKMNFQILKKTTIRLIVTFLLNNTKKSKNFKVKSPT